MKKLLFLALIFFVLSTPSHVLAVTTSPLPIKWIWVSATSRGKFNDAEYETIAGSYIMLLLDQYHGKPNKNGWISFYQAANDLAKISPTVKVFPYFNASIIRPLLNPLFTSSGFKDEWYLRDKTGNKVGYQNKLDIYYIDLSNPQYRAWALSLIQTWFDKAPFAGIVFDSVNNIDDVERRRYPEKLDAIGQVKIDAWNKGLKSLIHDAKQRFTGKLIAANGIDYVTPDSNASNLIDADIVTNERFCTEIHSLALKPRVSLLKDIEIGRLFTSKGKIVLQKTNFGEESNQATPAQKKLAGRFCTALFLMSYVPDRSYYKFGTGYGIYALSPTEDWSELDFVAPELDIALGTPVGENYTTSNQGDLLSRRFAAGIVYLNIGTTNLSVKLPFDATLINGNVRGASYSSGQTVTIPKQDAMYFVKQSTKPGDLNSDNLVNQADVTLLISKYGNPYTIYDYNTIVANWNK